MYFLMLHSNIKNYRHKRRVYNFTYDIEFIFIL